MANLTITVPEDLKAELQRHKEVNWSEVMRRAAREHLDKLCLAEAIAAKSALSSQDIKALDRLVKAGMARAHGLR